MADTRHQLLDEALALTERMARLGDGDDWQAVIELEPQRRQLLQRAFATQLPVDEIMAERVRTILDLDKHLMALTVAARDRIAGDISRSSKGRAAANAYRAAGA
ncbi:MAG: flagellar protein FliT [Gammaproteobacteria bacterium]|nr:flagellar protein FliT [Gammaproteobacteria bacterium]